MTKFDKGDWIKFAVGANTVFAKVIRVNAKTYTASTGKLERGGVAVYRVAHKQAQPA